MDWRAAYAAAWFAFHRMPRCPTRCVSRGGDAAGDADGGTLRDELYNLFEGLFFCLNIESVKASFFQPFYQCTAQPVAVFLSGRIELIRQFHRLHKRECPL